MLAKLRNGGQSCVGANRIYVQSGIAAEFTTRFTERMAAARLGDGAHPDTDLGPLVDAKQVKTVAALVTDAIAKGAVCLTGGTTPKAPALTTRPPS